MKLCIVLYKVLYYAPVRPTYLLGLSCVGALDIRFDTKLCQAYFYRLDRVKSQSQKKSPGKVYEMDYHIRYSRSFIDLSGTVKYIANNSEELVAVEHEADDEVSRTHIHMYVKGVTVTKQTLINQIKKAIPGITKSDFVHTTTYKDRETSESKPIDKGLITYISKGSLEPSRLHNITIEEYNELKSKWVNYENKNYGKNDIKRYVTVKENPKEKRLRKQDLVQQMIKKCNKDFQHNVVRDAIKKVIKDNGEILSVYKLTEYYDTIMLQCNDERFDKMFDDIIQKRFLR